MPTLNITKIKCVKKRDPIGKDEIDTYVLVDDSNTETFLSGPHFLDKSDNDDEVELSEAKAFIKKIRIRLKERNGTRGGENDLLLSPDKTVWADQRRNESVDAIFNGNGDRVHYTVSYNVTD